MDDGSLHQAIGWLTAAAGGRRCADQSLAAARYGNPEVAAHLMRWADLSVASLVEIEYADRRRHRAVANVELVASAGGPLYRCIDVCGHVGSSEAEMSAHRAERHEVER
jgi:hypothetical protein